MSTKLKTRLQQKRDYEANWILAGNSDNPFVPLAGELIIYLAEYGKEWEDAGSPLPDGRDAITFPRMKVGDGTTIVTELPFSAVPSDWSQSDETQPDYIKNRTHYERFIGDENFEVFDETFQTELETHFEFTRILDYSLVPNASYSFYVSGDEYYSKVTADGDGNIIHTSPEHNSAFISIIGNKLTCSSESTYATATTLRLTITGPARELKKLEAKYIPIDNDTIKVDADGKINVKDLADEKLDKAPDGSVDLLDENQKINLHYLSDAIVGQLKFGGTADIDGIISPSSILMGYLRDTVEGFGSLIDNATSSVDITLQSSPKHLCVDDSEAHYYDVNLEGFYFIMSESESEDYRCNFYTSEDLNNLLEVGDWVVAVGDEWEKIDNTDAVKTVNGKIGIVKIALASGDSTVSDIAAAGSNITLSYNESTNITTIAATDTTYTVDSASILTLNETTLSTDLVKRGIGTNSLNINRGVATGKNAVAIGRNTYSEDANGHIAENANGAIGTESFTIGTDNLAGSMAYTIVAVDESNKTYTLDSVDGLAIDDVYSLRLSCINGSNEISAPQKYNVGKITAINGNVVTVDTLFGPSDVGAGYTFNYIDPSNNPNFIDENGIDYETNAFRIIAKPHVGNRLIGSSTIALGSSNKALSKNAIAEGWGTIAYGSHAHAEGYATEASYAAHSEGKGTLASGFQSHAEGLETIASGTDSHAEGRWSKATSDQAHSEGLNTTASGKRSHAEGDSSKAIGQNSHAEGRSTVAGGTASHAEGLGGTVFTPTGMNSEVAPGAQGSQSHSEGTNTHAASEAAHTEGINTYASYAAHAEGKETTASGSQSHTEGYQTQATSSCAHAEGNATKASGGRAHAEGYKTVASGTNSHAEGLGGTAFTPTGADAAVTPGAVGSQSHVEGSNTYASGANAHAEGNNTSASQGNAHAEGNKTTASGWHSHAEGTGTLAKGNQSHAEGNNSQATGSSSHAEGQDTTASSDQAHAEGYNTKATGNKSHAEGHSTVASGAYSHAGGLGTIAAGDGQTAIGKYNKEDLTSLFIVGKGTGDSASSRSNAFVVTSDGRATAGADPTGNLDLVTLRFHTSAIQALETKHDTEIGNLEAKHDAEIAELRDLIDKLSVRVAELEDAIEWEYTSSTEPVAFAELGGFDTDDSAMTSDTDLAGFNDEVESTSIMGTFN